MPLDNEEELQQEDRDLGRAAGIAITRVRKLRTRWAFGVLALLFGGGVWERGNDFRLIHWVFKNEPQIPNSVVLSKLDTVQSQLTDLRADMLDVKFATGRIARYTGTEKRVRRDIEQHRNPQELFEPTAYFPMLDK